MKELGPVMELSGEACDFNKRDRDDPLRWLLIQAEESVVLPDPGGGERHVRVKPTRIVPLKPGRVKAARKPTSVFVSIPPPWPFRALAW